MTHEESPPRIVIVDDDPIIARVVEKYLNRVGFDCRSFEDSWVAMTQIPILRPDLILLDYLMPNLNGPDFCRLLKRSPILSEIPVIFITSLEGNDTIIKAFDAGAVDYVVKPVNTRELVVRIKNQIELARSRSRIRDYAEQMERLADERARQLMAADRLVMLGALAGGIMHEIEHPNAVISSNLLALKRFWDQVRELPKDGFSSEQIERWNYIDSEMPGLVDSMQKQIEGIRKTVDNLRGFHRKEIRDVHPLRTERHVESALNICQTALQSAKVEVRRHTPIPGIVIEGNPQQFEQVLVNLLINSADAMSGGVGGFIDLAAFAVDGKAHFVYCDDGPGTDPENLTRLFQPFYTTKDLGQGAGLGLPISKKIIESHGGSMEAMLRNDPRWRELVDKYGLHDVIPQASTGLAYHIVMPLHIEE
jgi:two-component system, NtrC family, sensor kinase